MFLTHVALAAVVTVSFWGFGCLWDWMYPVREPQFFGAVPVRYLLDTGDVAIIVVFIVFGTIEATRAFLSAEPDLKPPQKRERATAMKEGNSPPTGVPAKGRS